MIVALLSVFLGLTASTLVGAVWLLVKASKKLLQFDELTNYLVDDMETNVKYFDELTTTPVLTNVPELQDAHKNMTVMSARLQEFLSRFEELTGTVLRKKTKRPAPVPVVD
jgi:hypothetical protein